MKKPFAIDIDDVQGNLSQVLNPALNKRFEKDIPLSGWYTFNLASLYGITLEQFLQTVIEERLLERTIPYPGVKEVLRRIKAAGHGVVHLTSRGYHPNGFQLTETWLNQNDLYADNLVIVPEGMSKAEAVADRYPWGFAVMVDDYPPNLDKMVEAGLVEVTYLIDKPWNQDRSDYVMGKNRFSTLVDAIRHHFEFAMTVDSQPA